MTSTSNYQLSQWAATDHILREDFNADNQKIDAALARKKEYVKLKEVTLTAKHTGTYTLDLSDIDWGAWQYVLVDLDTVGSGTYYMRTNGNANALCGYSAGVSSNTGKLRDIKPEKMLRFIFLPFCKPNRPVDAVFIGIALGSAYDHNINFTELTYIELTAADTSVYLNPGTHFTVWGIA